MDTTKIAVFSGIDGFGYYIKIEDKLFYRDLKGQWQIVMVPINLGEKHNRPRLPKEKVAPILEELNGKI